MRTSDYKPIATCLRVLANERRLAIVRFLTNGPRVVWEISAHVQCSEQAASKHLRRLLDCGMVTREQTGFSATYSLVRSHPFIRMVLPKLPRK
jgi:DNA-binding HxlR family transcriptional regulator